MQCTEKDYFLESDLEVSSPTPAIRWPTTVCLINSLLVFMSSRICVLGVTYSNPADEDEDENSDDDTRL